MNVDFAHPLEGLAASRSFENGVEAAENDISETLLGQLVERLRCSFELPALVVYQIGDRLELLWLEDGSLLAFRRSGHNGSDLVTHSRCSWHDIRHVDLPNEWNTDCSGEVVELAMLVTDLIQRRGDDSRQLRAECRGLTRYGVVVPPNRRLQSLEPTIHFFWGGAHGDVNVAAAVVV